MLAARPATSLWPQDRLRRDIPRIPAHVLIDDRLQVAPVAIQEHPNLKCEAVDGLGVIAYNAFESN